MRIRTVGEQLTFYDEEGNIVIQIPNGPPDFSDENCRTLNILDFEDRLMGRDPNAKPDFFIDLEALDEFADKHDLTLDDGRDKFACVDGVIIMMLMFALFFGMAVLGYMFGGHLMDLLNEAG